MGRAVASHRTSDRTCSLSRPASKTLYYPSLRVRLACGEVAPLRPWLADGAKKTKSAMWSPTTSPANGTPPLTLTKPRWRSLHKAPLTNSRGTNVPNGYFWIGTRRKPKRNNPKHISLPDLTTIQTRVLLPPYPASTTATIHRFFFLCIFFFPWPNLLCVKTDWPVLRAEPPKRFKLESPRREGQTLYLELDAI